MNIIFNFVISVATKKGRTTNFFHFSLLLLFLDPGSGWTKIRIRDKHPASAPLSDTVGFFARHIVANIHWNCAVYYNRRSLEHPRVLA
jgi:hypothetical protein